MSIAQRDVIIKLTQSKPIRRQIEHTISRRQVAPLPRSAGPGLDGVHLVLRQPAVPGGSRVRQPEGSLHVGGELSLVHVF